MSIDQRKLTAYLSDRFESPLNIAGLKRLSGGACQDNYRVDLEVERGEHAGTLSFVLRTDKAASIESSLTRVQEYHVASRAFEAGVRTPRQWFFEQNEAVLGHPFVVMEMIQGKAGGRFVVKDRSLNGKREDILIELAEHLHKIHSVTPKNFPDADYLVSGNATDSEKYALATVKNLRTMVDDLETVSPGLELLFNWLEDHPPEFERFVLVHGDFRTGNYMVSPEGLHGIIDWEFAHWGDGYEDIAWFCMRDWRFGKNSLEAGGIGSRDAFCNAYAAASGTPVDRQRLRYWEIVGNLKWAIGARRQSWRHLAGLDRGIELALIGRRACEMEYEAMRLVEEYERVAANENTEARERPKAYP